MPAAATIWARQVRKFTRNGMELFGTVLQPLLWMVLFGAGVQGVMARGVDRPEYLAFMTPGILALTAVMGAVAGGASFLEERLRGIVKEYWVAPIARWSILVGTLAASSTKALIQAGLILVTGLFMGARPVGGPAGWVASLGLLLVFSMGFAGVAAAAAMTARSTGAYHGVIFLLNLPLLFASNALVPLAVLPGWLAWLARLNPVTYLTAAVRALTYGQPSEIPTLAASAVLLLFGGAGVLLALGSFRRLSP
ncbi:ABC transporter permease [Limnochorda pilosa]|uniref:Transport permease protein n=1 Tax=Limnochorda pilosa TaxID=1555112 RepID=A0A0K2SGP0_LIMPI|nr:ABC transporter permease [Limnochorda pilosa]BAS26009.1 ABC transporter [Limnochorda pilosa]